MPFKFNQLCAAAYATESDAAKTIQVLREKLRRSRQMQTSLFKQLNRVSSSS